MNNEDIKKHYYENGYVILKSNFSLEECNDLKKYLDSMPPKVFIPFTEIPWGWGNLIDDNNLKFIVNDDTTNNLLSQILGDYVYNHLYVHNKVKWYGLLENWHQEVYNIKTFAPGYDKEDWDCFAQVYVPLDPQNLENGCLKIIPKSHKMGVLEHIDFIGPNMGHKRITTNTDIEKAYQEYGILNLELNPGDVVIFNHLLLHGSTSNNSPFNRRAIVLQARSNIKEKSNAEFDAETMYRTNYTASVLRTELEKQEAKRALYSDSHIKGH